MNKNVKTALIPKYRFWEFVENGPVICENGNLIFKQVSNKTHNSDLPILAISQEYGAIPRDEIDYKVSVTEKSLESYKVVEKGDFIISLRSFQGGIEYSTYHGICSPAYIILRKKIDVEEQYYKYYFKSNRFIQDLNKDLEGIRDGKMVNYNQFSNILLPKPDKKEQQKIADCLISLDDLITAEDKKLSALKDHKKGLMQKLFPVEGKTVPEWRFPEFRDCEEWEYFKLSDIGEIITGSTPATNKNEYYGGQFMFASPSDISDKRYLNSTKTTLSELGFQQTRHIKANSILFVCIGSTIGKLAQNREVCATNQQINSLVPFENYHNSFVYFALEFSSNVISNLAGKQAVPIVNKTLFSNVVIPLPLEKKEQEKISDCLSSVDELIAGQADKIKALKEQKKGLMQGLFPSIEEVSR
ncbi:restriction endonuclease subunit S [Lacrimispora sp. BS-2]|uniref:Restriction endonuclease subunit S n=1 Tax=Lacrimispora sp. BS-2 TaxID=3151850 RepID=A0AAU7PM07_9FIRM